MTTHTPNKEWLSVPVAIVIAGALIGAGAYLGARSIAKSSVLAGAKVADQAAQPSGGAAPAPDANVKVPEVTSKDHIRGNKNADVVIVEYSDTECPFCKMFHSTMQQVMSKYESGGKVAWVYRHFPLDQLHKKAAKEAEATECAAELGGNAKFWAYIDALFEKTTSNDGLAESELPNLAQQVGIDRTAFERCLASGKHASTVRDQAAGGASAGVQGTPHSIIITKDGNTPVSGAVPFEQIDTIIQNALK